MLGSGVWGIGRALLEALVAHGFGRCMNHNLAEHHIPMNADVHDIDVILVEAEGGKVNPLGVRGIGEIGFLGVAAAIANAVFHATGNRVRHLPVSIDKLL